MKKSSIALEIARTEPLEWIHVSKTRPQELAELTKTYGIHPLDAHDILPPLQRPKIVRRETYIFMILLYPWFNEKTQTVHLSELDFFISSTRLITVNTDALPALTALFASCKSTLKEKKVCMTGDITHLVYTLLNGLLTDVFPLVLRLSAHSDAIEMRLFQDYEKDLIQDLLRLKTNITNVRRSLQGHKHTLRSLLEQASGILKIDTLQAYFEKIIEQSEEIWDVLEIERDTINALHETNASLIDYRINEIIKTLTIFSVILFPLTLIAGIFGMNAINMPIVNNPHGFWIILGLMGAGMLGMLTLFKKKKWI